MRIRVQARPSVVVAVAAAIAVAAPVQAHDEQAGPGSGSPTADTRFSLAGGCRAVRAAATGRAVAAGHAPFRMQATELGKYLFLAAKGDFLAAGQEGEVVTVTQPSAAAEWQIDGAGNSFRIFSPATGKAWAVAPGTGELVLSEPAGAGRFGFVGAEGCAEFPEAQLNVTGGPFKGRTPYGEVTGLLDAHAHMLAFEAFGGGLHCGRPWHPFGITFALVDCPDHYPNGELAVAENLGTHGVPAGPTHDPVGWPTFNYWPHHESVSHEQVYYRWLERTWRGGLRIFVLLAADNAALCALVNPRRTYDCNEMKGAYRQLRDAHALQDYIDAQHGGPGRGWFRIVRDPFEARRVVNAGKLAVVLGIEISELFDCGLRNDVPQCDRAQIDRELDNVYSLGVRDLELVNKFDNALAGVAFDAETNGALVNFANKFQTGRFWEMETCTGPESDRRQYTVTGSQAGDLIAGAVQVFAPPGELPVYPPPPHCNKRGLSALGEHLLRRMMSKGMIVDPDHMSVLARKQTLALLEAHRYSGVVSSHSWSDSAALPRIYALGGVVTPYAGDSTTFVDSWRKVRRTRSRKFFFGFGYGDDMNGVAKQGAPRPGNAANPVEYPFRSFDGGTSVDRQRSGRRVYDINRDGVAHFGLYPDWVEDLRKIAGDAILRDLARGAEAYLQMWERATGIPGPGCRPARAAVTRRGIGAVRIGDSPEALLRRAGQPARRPGRAYRYCVRGRGGRVVAVFTPARKVGLVLSTAPGHVPSRVRADARRLVVKTTRGRVRYVAVASAQVARTRARLRHYLRLGGLR